MIFYEGIIEQGAKTGAEHSPRQVNVVNEDVLDYPHVFILFRSSLRGIGYCRYGWKAKKGRAYSQRSAGHLFAIPVVAHGDQYYIRSLDDDVIKQIQKRYDTIIVNGQTYSKSEFKNVPLCVLHSVYASMYGWPPYPHDIIYFCVLKSNVRRQLCNFLANYNYPYSSASTWCKLVAGKSESEIEEWCKDKLRKRSERHQQEYDLYRLRKRGIVDRLKEIGKKRGREGIVALLEYYCNELSVDDRRLLCQYLRKYGPVHWTALGWVEDYLERHLCPSPSIWDRDDAFHTFCKVECSKFGVEYKQAPVKTTAAQPAAPAVTEEAVEAPSPPPPPPPPPSPPGVQPPTFPSITVPTATGPLFLMEEGGEEEEVSRGEEVEVTVPPTPPAEKKEEDWLPIAIIGGGLLLLLTS